MALALKGAVIVREYEGPNTHQITYRQRCDVCGYVAPKPPITVTCLPESILMYRCGHIESFVCPFCRSHQVVDIQV